MDEADHAAIQAAISAGREVNADNFRADVNTDGIVNRADLAQARAP